MNAKCKYECKHIHYTYTRNLYQFIMEFCKLNGFILTQCRAEECTRLHVYSIVPTIQYHHYPSTTATAATSTAIAIVTIAKSINAKIDGGKMKRVCVNLTFSNLM